jgi:hypothetical protein
LRLDKEGEGRGGRNEVGTEKGEKREEMDGCGKKWFEFMSAEIEFVMRTDI